MLLATLVMTIAYDVFYCAYLLQGKKKSELWQSAFLVIGTLALSVLSVYLLLQFQSANY